MDTTQEVFYLHEIPEKSKIHESCSDGSKFFIFHHPDGMYSYCVTEKGAIVHLGMMQPLVKFADGYKFFDHFKSKASIS